MSKGKNKKIKNQIQLYKKLAETNMTEKEHISTRRAIHTTAAAAAGVGAGLAQIPGSDSAILVTLQIAMIRKIGKTFEIKVTESSAETIIGTSLATMAGRGLSQILAGWIPIAGNIINAGTAALITELLGWMIANEFAEQSKKRPS